MKKLRNHKILNHPILGMFLLPTWFLLLNSLFSAVFNLTVRIIGMAQVGVLYQCIEACVPITAALVGLLIHKAWFQGTFKGCISKDNILVGLKYAALALVVFMGANLIGVKSFANPAIALLLGAAPGISEEVMFRSLSISNAMRNLKKDSQIVTFVLVSALFFGLFHAGNLLMGAGFSVTLSQVTYATGMGILLGAIYMRTGNILPCMIMHTLVDFSAFLNADLMNNAGILTEQAVDLTFILTTALFFIVPTVTGLYLIRKEKWAEIKEVWATKWTTEQTEESVQAN